MPLQVIESTDFNYIYNQLFEDAEKEKSDEEFKDIINKNAPLIQSERRIFVYGTELNQRITNVKDANFTKVIQNNLFKCGYRSVFPTQAHSWNEIIDGRSVTVVNSRNSGKTMTFLPALLSILSNKLENDESELQGPIAIIITNTSREVESLYHLSRKLLPDKDIKIVKAFGIWNFKEKCFELLNGCDLLITTPLCFKRFCEIDTVKMFNRSRIKHLVLENLDIMYKKFKPELEVILENCTKGINSPQNNPQIIITATCWQDFLHFFSKLSAHPIIVIDAYIEAALFAKSRFIVSRRTLEDKNQLIMNNLEEFEWRFHATALVFSRQDEIDNFKILLGNKSLPYEVLDENTVEYDMYVWSRLPKGKRTVLLILDDILTRVNIENIQILIHYSLPETWTAFSRRFSLSLSYYVYYMDMQDKNKENQPRAVIYLDKNNVNEIPRIINFLSDRRLVKEIPDYIQDEAQKIKNEMERSKSDADNEVIVPLCSNILKFSSCSRYKCTFRHAFIPSDEPQFIPKSGKIKFILIGMSSPLHLVAIITGYLEPNTTEWISYQDKINATKQALKEFQDYMSDEENHVMDFPRIDGLYGYFNIQNCKWQRCKVTKLDEKTDSTISQKAFIEFIDDGGRSKVNITALMKLPDDIKSLDPLCCDIRIVNLVPYDSDEIFDHETIDVVEKHFAKVQSKNDYMMCNIELAVGHTIITTDVTFHKLLNSLNIDVMNLSMRKYLKDNKFALNENILDRLMDIAASCNFYKAEKSVKIVETVPKKVIEIIEEQKSNYKILHIGRTYKVTLLNFQNPELFYVQLIDKDLSKIKSELKMIEEYSEEAVDLLKNYKVNTICLIKLDDDQMRRCIITKIEPLTVCLLDYGTELKTELLKLYKISNDMIMSVPFQAIKCGIKGLKTRRICNLVNILAYKKLFKQISKNDIFELEVHSKSTDRYIVTAFNSENNLNFKDLALKQCLGELTSEEIEEENVRQATEHFLNILKNDENVCLNQIDANNMLGLPSTARFLPPKEISNALKESEEKLPKKSLKAIESARKVSSVANNVKLPCKVPRILSLLKMSERNSAKPENIKIAKMNENIPKIKELKLSNLFSTVNVEWNQNNGILMLRFEALDLIDYSLKVTQTRCEICIKYADKTALTNIEFYGRIMPKHVVHKSAGRYITMFVIKKYSDALWPRLTFSDHKNINIKYIAEDLKISFPDIEFKEESKERWAPAGFYSDNEDDNLNEYDDCIEDDENQV